MGYRVLFISRHHHDADTLARMLAPVSIGLEHVATLRDARVELQRSRFGAVLTEAYLPDGTWKDLLSLTYELRVSLSVIVTHLVADDRFWAEVLNLGCYDMLAQPFDTREVQRILALACAQTRSKPAVRAEAARSRMLSATC
jgi:DNA-binding NtrC family response regulator